MLFNRFSLSSTSWGAKRISFIIRRGLTPALAVKNRWFSVKVMFRPIEIRKMGSYKVGLVGLEGVIESVRLTHVDVRKYKRAER